MDRAASFVVRWRITIIALTLAVALSATWIVDVKAEGPRSSGASILALGDWDASGEAGRRDARGSCGRDDNGSAHRCSCRSSSASRP